MGRVAGKVALIAGAGGGIGGAAAEAMAREGAAVFCTDRDGAAAEATAARIRVAGGQAAASGLDVCDRAAVDAMIAAVVREFGRLDIVLESAGISHRLNFLDLDPDTWPSDKSPDQNPLLRALLRDGFGPPQAILEGSNEEDAVRRLLIIWLLQQAPMGSV